MFWCFPSISLRVIFDIFSALFLHKLLNRLLCSCITEKRERKYTKNIMLIIKKNCSTKQWKKEETSLSVCVECFVKKQRYTFFVYTALAVSVSWRSRSDSSIDEEKNNKRYHCFSCSTTISNSITSSSTKPNREINKIYSDVNTSLFHYSLFQRCVCVSSGIYHLMAESFFFAARLCVRPRWDIKIGNSAIIYICYAR